MLDNTPSQTSKCRTKRWVKIKQNDSRGTYNTNNQIKFKTSTLNASLCDYSNAYILFKGTITLIGQVTDTEAIQEDRNNKQVVFKNSASFPDCMTEINNTQVNINNVNPMHNLIEYSDNYLLTTGTLWRYQNDVPRNPMTDSISFQFKTRFVDNTNDQGIINTETAMPLKYLT